LNYSLASKPVILVGGEAQETVSYSWLALTMLSLQAYSMFGAQPALSLTLFHRLANHVPPPVSILALNGLVRIIDFFRGNI
jgi:hypothetical protein